MTVTDPATENDVERLRDQIRACARCELHRGATNAVPGEGPVPAEVMLIGEAPGWHEDKQGVPFIGAAGQFLDELLQGIGLERAQVFITNVVKHRPPGNRDPLPDEIVACAPYLEQQIELVQPHAIVTLGRFSMARWFAGQRISQIHGQPKQFERYVVIPMYHPAAALHQGALRATIEADFKKLPRLLAEARRQREIQAATKAPKAEQIRLF